MWLATKIGFYSIVKKHDEEDTFIIRARERNDIEELKRSLHFLKKRKVYEYKDSDYLCRIFVNSEELKVIMVSLVNEIDYDNFKNEIKKNKKQKGKLPYYSNIWYEMFLYQKRNEKHKGNLIFYPYEQIV